MAYKIIQKFVDMLGDHHVATFTGPLTPLLLQIPWSKNPAIPIITLAIHRGRETLVAVDEHYYHLSCEERFRQYFEKRVSKEELEKEYYDYAGATRSIYDEAARMDFSRASEEAILAFLKKMIAVWERVASTVYIETLDYNMALRVVGRGNKPLLDAIWEQATHPTFISFEGRWLAHLINLPKKSKEKSATCPKAR